MIRVKYSSVICICLFFAGVPVLFSQDNDNIQKFEPDTELYQAFDGNGVAEIVLEISSATHQVTVDATNIPLSEFQECKLESGTVGKMVKLVVLNPDADQNNSKIKFWKNWPNNSSDGHVVLERGPGKIEIKTSGSEEQTYVKYLLKLGVFLDEVAQKYWTIGRQQQDVGVLLNIYSVRVTKYS